MIWKHGSEIKNSLGSVSIILLALFIALLAPAVPAQIKTGGEIVEVVNGKTVVVEIPAGRITVELLYIDVPEPAQALHTVVKNHVRGLLLGKVVDVETRGLSSGTVTGKLLVQGVDISLQLVRDGAAWHLPMEISAQSKSEFDSYAEAEALARKEKRGVWSITGLKPSWQLRAENEEMRRRAEARIVRPGKPALVGVSEFQTDTRRASGKPPAAVTRRSQMDAWVDTFAFAKNEAYGLHIYNEPNGRYQAVYSSPIVMDLNSAGGKEKLECRVMYITGTRYDGATVSMYMIGFRAISEEYRFSKVRTQLTAIVDGKTFSLGAFMGGLRGQGLIGSGAVASGEIMYFRTNKAAIYKISNGRKVEFRINRFTGTLPAEAQDLFKQVAAAGG